MTQEHLAAVVAFYERRTAEDARLDTEVGQLEAARLRELFGRHLPPPPATILDVGGGTGRHASYLAGLGYDVLLVDPVPSHVAIARERAYAGRRFSAAIGDARALDVADAAFDAVLLFGPLYHLPVLGDRQAALSEARRVLRADGTLLAIGINTTATVLTSLSKDDRDTTFADIAYFHEPDTLASEVADAGFAVRAVVGVEGPAWLLGDLAERWADGIERERILAVSRAVEAERSLLGVSPHLLVVARSPA